MKRHFLPKSSRQTTIVNLWQEEISTYVLHSHRLWRPPVRPKGVDSPREVHGSDGHWHFHSATPGFESLNNVNNYTLSERECGQFHPRMHLAEPHYARVRSVAQLSVYVSEAVHALDQTDYKNKMTFSRLNLSFKILLGYCQKFHSTKFTVLILSGTGR